MRTVRKLVVARFGIANGMMAGMFALVFRWIWLKISERCSRFRVEHGVSDLIKGRKDGGVVVTDWPIDVFVWISRSKTRHKRTNLF